MRAKAKGHGIYLITSSSHDGLLPVLRVRFESHFIDMIRQATPDVKRHTTSAPWQSCIWLRVLVMCFTSRACEDDADPFAIIDNMILANITCATVR